MGNGPKNWPSVISKEAAALILAPVQDDLIQTILIGWSAFSQRKKSDPELYAVVLPRTRASIVHDFAIREAKGRFNGREHENIRTRPEFDSLLIILGEHLVLRIKKFDDSERARNSRTGRQWKFDRQCLELPGISTESTKVTAGYKLNCDQTEIAKIAVTCWCVNTLKWSISLYEPGASTAVFNFLPLPPGPPLMPKSVVKPRTDSKKLDEGDT